jgi:hypothetical protein
MNRLVLAMAAFGASVLSAPAGAATILVDGSGHLTGAAGVQVLGTFYDVSFVDGTCASVFGGCNDAADFDFNDSVLAMFAAQALLDQVFIGHPIAEFRDNPSLTVGCVSAVLSCSAIVPFEVSPLSSSFADTFLAHIGLIDNDEVRGPQGFSSTFDTTSENSLDGLVYARFTLSAGTSQLPEPSTWMTMLLGFGAVGFAMRRSPKAEDRAARRAP